MATNYDPAGSRAGDALKALLAENLITQPLLDALNGTNKMVHQGIGTYQNPESPLASVDELVKGVDVAWVDQSGDINLGAVDSAILKDLNLLIMTSDDGVRLFDEGSFGGEVLFGGAGDNAFVYDGSKSVVVSADKNVVYDFSTPNEVSVTTGTHVGNDTIITGSGRDTIAVGDGDNFVASGGGNDSVKAGEGNNHITLGAGNDSVEAGDGDNWILGQAGNDTVKVGDGNDTIYGGAGNDSITVGTGNDLIFGEAGNDVIFVNASSIGNDTVSGGAGNDKITLANGNNLVDGGLGNDTIIAGSGNDSIQGGLGNDSINAGAGTDTVLGGAGVDTIRFGASAGDSINGGDGNDTIIVTSSNGAGSVTIDGGAGTKGGTADILNLSGVTIASGTVNLEAKTADLVLDTGTHLLVSNIEKFVYNVDDDATIETVTLTGLNTFLDGLS